MDDPRLTEALRRVADEASPSGSPEAVARRAQRRLRRNVGLAAVCSVVVLAGALVGVRSLGRTDATQPIVPAPTAPSIEPTVEQPTLVPSPTTSTEPSPEASARGPIVFVRGLDDNAEIYIVREDGSGVRRLTRNAVEELFPVWSPDHSQIAFMRATATPDVWEIWVMRADGSEAHRIRGGIESVAAPDLAWSKRGGRLAFTSSHAEQAGGITVECEDLWTVGVDGRNATRILRDHGTIGGIDWSPDGEQIVYGAEGGGMSCAGPSGMFIINADGSGRIDLESEKSFSPSWSPDGREIVFHTWRRTCHACGEIWRMNVDGSRQRPFFASQDSSEAEGLPSWAADGTRILFLRNEIIHTARADGSGLRRVTTGSQPDW